MFGLIGRILIYIGPIVVWVIMNRKLDELEDRKSYLREHNVWGKLYWLYGWTLGVKKLGTYVRYFLSGAALLLLLRWFFIITSTTPR